MNLDSLTHTSGEWLRGTGPESDIVISSRIRLARNLAAFPFTNRASALPEGRDRGAAARPHRQARARPAAGLRQRAHACRPLDRQFLVERQLISRELAAADGPRGVAVWRRSETVSLMVNEEDHLRLQVHAQRLRPRRGLAGDRPRRRPARSSASPTPSARSSAT